MLLISLWLSIALATDAICPPANPSARAYRLEGVDGVWFGEAHARCLLRDIDELGARRREVGLLQERLRLSDSRHATMQAMVNEQQASIEALEASLRDARERFDPVDWWESPFFWAPVSLVLGVIGGLVLGLWATR